MPLKDKEKRAVYQKTYYEVNEKKLVVYIKAYRKTNKEKLAAKKKIYYETNKEKIVAHVKAYSEANKEKINAYRKNRFRTNHKIRLNNLISGAIRDSLKNGNGKNGYHWEDLVPYSLDNLIKRLKKTLPKGYKWEDYINGKTDLQIDHKIPVAVHNFKLYTNTDFQKCWALKNLQLMPAKDNRSKGATLSKPFQPSLLL